MGKCSSERSRRIGARHDVSSRTAYSALRSALYKMVVGRAKGWSQGNSSACHLDCFGVLGLVETPQSIKPVSGRAIRRCLLALLFCIVCAPQFSGAADTDYVYDELGRLTGQIQADGAARYHYDGAGNLLAVDRANLGQPLVIEFQDSAPVGQFVLIRGAGFRSDTNTVTFNGTPAAQVIFIDPTRLLAVVPAGAAPGPITVTNAAGTSTSLTLFSVAPPNAAAAPVIDGFTPAQGAPGTTVTLSGANFSADASLNLVYFNGVATGIKTAVPGQLTVIVPTGGSGRITVVTEHGTAPSAGDFIIQPPDFALSNIAEIKRVALGSTTALSFAGAGKAVLLLVDILPTQRASMIAIAQGFGIAEIRVRDPNGQLVGTDTALAGSVKGFIGPWSGLSSGPTHTLLVIPDRAVLTGASVTLHNVPPDPYVGATIGGPEVNSDTQVPGQISRIFFDANAGQRVSATLYENLVSVFPVEVIHEATDAVLWQDSTFGFDPVLGPFVLPATGRYVIRARPFGAEFGNIRVKVYSVPPDPQLDIVPGGSAVTVNLASPGQAGKLKFPATSGERILVSLTEITIGNCTKISIVQPDGTELAAFNACSSSFVVDARLLPATGQYSILIDPQDAGVGTLKAQLYRVPPDVVSTLTANGPSFTASTAVGQNIKLTFSGAANQRIGLRVLSETYSGSVPITIYKPAADGSASTTAGTIVDLCCFDGGEWTDALTLPAGGIYTVFVNPSGTAIGSITLDLLGVPPNLTGTLTVNGPVATLALSAPGQNARYTFSAAAGQTVTVRVTENVVGSTGLTLVGPLPAATVIRSTTSSSSSFSLSSAPLGTVGSYAIDVNPGGMATGSLKLGVTSP